MTKEKSLYQAKLIIECLPKDEYKLIPKDIIEYIEKNMQYDEKIKINANIDLEKQNIDEKTYEILDKILKRIQISSEQRNNEKIQIHENEEIISLKNIIRELKKENEKIADTKELVLGYREEIKRLNYKCNLLEEKLNSIPNFVKMIFIKKNKNKLLETSK